jgi:8-oxo-dGTP diphosphatase
VSCFLQKGKQFLVLQRARNDAQHNLWGIPGGKLDKGEMPQEGLSREIYEETNIKLLPSTFLLLGTALSHTPSDGQYGLYIYHTFVPDNTNVIIDTLEHHMFRWVTLEEFKALPLLTAQGEAFQLVENKISYFVNQKKQSVRGEIC